jgi:hypothetical protein
MDENNIWDSLLLQDSVWPHPAISNKSSKILFFRLCTSNINNYYLFVYLTEATCLYVIFLFIIFIFPDV